MKNKLTDKEKYGTGFIHTFLYKCSEQQTVKLKNEILFKNFDENYLTNLLDKSNLKTIFAHIAGKNNITYFEIAINIQTKPNHIIEIIRKYPTSHDIYNSNKLFETLNLNDGFFKQTYNMNWQRYLGYDIEIASIYMALQHNNHELYQIL